MPRSFRVASFAVVCDLACLENFCFCIEQDPLREAVNRELRCCILQREASEKQACALVQLALTPVAPLLYWLQKRLPADCPAVQVPCEGVQIQVDAVAAASQDVAVMVISAALQSVHARQWMPCTKVRACVLKELCPLKRSNLSRPVLTTIQAGDVVGTWQSRHSFGHLG
jgi:hypothetical protein